ncbi:MAG: FtsX-like permease family protein [Chloroflexota bacterium]
MLATLIPVGILVLAYGSIAVFAWRRPLLARLAIREAVRRPRHSALLVLGMMFGTAAILGMQGAFDSVDHIFKDIVYNTWGRTDITVSQRGQPFSMDVARSIAADPRVTAKATGVQGAFVLVGSAADLDQRLSAAPVQIATFDASQPSFGSLTLRNGQAANLNTLGTDQAILNSALATRLNAVQGDRVEINFVAGGRPLQIAFRVGGITRAGSDHFIGLQPGIHVPLAALQGVVGAGTINLVRISARGTGPEEIDNAHLLLPAVRAAVAAIPSGSNSLEVREVKAEDLRWAIKLTSNFRYVFTLLSLFVVLAATALVINLTLALAEERRPRLAVLRALGLTRTQLVLTSLIEGAVYSLSAALIGTLPGLAYTYYVDSRPLPDATGVQPGVSIFTIAPESIAFSICAGALITLLTILLVSIRTSRMAISSAIRDLPEPPEPKRRSWLRISLAGILVVGGAAGWLPGDPALRLLGGTALIVAASMLARGRVSERVRATLTGFAVVIWSLFTIASATSPSFSALGLALAGVVVSVFGAAVAISANLRLLEAAVSLASVRLVTTLRPTLAYLTRRPVRAGLSTGTFALVLGALALFAVYFPTSQPDISKIGGGYDLAVKAGTRDFAIPASMQGQVTRADAIPTVAYVGPYKFEVSGGNGWSSTFMELYVFSDDQLNHLQLSLDSRDKRYRSDAAMWEAVRDDPSLVVSTWLGALGSISMVGPGGQVTRRIVGVAGNALLAGQGPGFIGSERSFTPLASIGDGQTILIKTAPGVDPRAFGLELRRATFGQGVDTRFAADMVATVNQQFGWFSGFFTFLLQTAVVVGVLSLGILALRAAIERRRTIGVMRALGYRPGQILGGMLVEATIAATVGIAVGIGLGLTAGYLYVNGFGRFNWATVDFGLLLIPALAIYAAVLLVTVGPAISASRMSTSEALRIIG